MSRLLSVDSGTSSIEDAAYSHGVSSAFLINDDNPTEVGNPPLRWNVLFPGDEVLLPSGELEDEGLFALPDNTPWSLDDFVAGVVPQDQLDTIQGMVPLGNPDLAQLEGRKCVGVTYDSDISIDLDKAEGNLQGARYGLFFFTVLDVVDPGTLPESGSSSSLDDLLMRVESAQDLGSFCVETFDPGTNKTGTSVPPALASQEVPEDYTLHQNYPNPFNPQTTLRFDVPEASHVSLVVYDVLGRQVRVLVDGTREAGTHEVVFEAGNLPSGTYLMRLVTPQGSFVQTMQLVK